MKEKKHNIKYNTTKPTYDKTQYWLYGCFPLYCMMSDDTSVLIETLVQRFMTHEQMRFAAYIWIFSFFSSFDAVSRIEANTFSMGKKLHFHFDRLNRAQHSVNYNYLDCSPIVNGSTSVGGFGSYFWACMKSCYFWTEKSTQFFRRSVTLFRSKIDVAVLASFFSLSHRSTSIQNREHSSFTHELNQININGHSN